MSFQLGPFFNGFAHYLQVERAGALRFLAVTAAFEHWFQFEAGAWINENRAKVGLIADDWSIALELKKGDTWLVNRKEPAFVGIEFKCIHNNKNFYSKIRELRRDLSDDKVLPKDFCKENTNRLGLAILVYLRYKQKSGGGYQIIGGKSDPWPIEKFLEQFRSECASSDAYYADVPQSGIAAEVELVSLDGGKGIMPSSGLAVWLALTSTGQSSPLPSLTELVPTDYCDPVIEAYKKDVDRTLLRENLKLNVEERFRKFERFMATVAELREAGRKARSVN